MYDIDPRLLDLLRSDDYDVVMQGITIGHTMGIPVYVLAGQHVREGLGANCSPSTRRMWGSAETKTIHTGFGPPTSFR